MLNCILLYTLRLLRLSFSCNLIPEGVRKRTGRWIISHKCSWINGLCILMPVYLFIVYSNGPSTRTLFVNCLMTHKYRGSQQSSREVKPNFIDLTQGEPKNKYKL